MLGNGNGGSSSDENILTGEVAEVMFVGEALECQVVVGDNSMRLKLHPTTKTVPGQKIELAIAVDRCRVLAEQALPAELDPRFGGRVFHGHEFGAGFRQLRQQSFQR